MPVLIIGWNIYDKLPEEEQKEFALVERYRTNYFYECYEYENAKGNKNFEWSDRCFKNQEELLEFFGYEMIEDFNSDAVYARRVETLPMKTHRNRCSKSNSEILLFRLNKGEKSLKNTYKLQLLPSIATRN